MGKRGKTPNPLAPTPNWTAWNKKPETRAMIDRYGADDPTMQAFMKVYETNVRGAGSNVQRVAKSIVLKSKMLPALGVTLLISALGHYTKSQYIRKFDGDVPCSKLIELSKHAGCDSRYMNDPGLRGWEFCTICQFFANFSTFTKIPQVPSIQAHSPVKTHQNGPSHPLLL